MALKYCFGYAWCFLMQTAGAWPVTCPAAGVGSQPLRSPSGQSPPPPPIPTERPKILFLELHCIPSMQHVADPDTLVRGTNPDPDPSLIKQK
jgi:hypothetical protein